MQYPLTPVSAAAAAALLNSQGAAEYGSNGTVSPCVRVAFMLRARMSLMIYSVKL